MGDFDKYLEEIVDGIKDLAKELLGGYTKEALQDWTDFAEEAKHDLSVWTAQLESGEISKGQFETLVLGQRDVAKLHALKHEGLALASIQGFRSGLFNLIIDKAFDVFL